VFGVWVHQLVLKAVFLSTDSGRHQPSDVRLRQGQVAGAARKAVGRGGRHQGEDSVPYLSQSVLYTAISPHNVKVGAVYGTLTSHLLEGVLSSRGIALCPGNNEKHLLTVSCSRAPVESTCRQTEYWLILWRVGSGFRSKQRRATLLMASLRIGAVA
jgi:hypothetical protein